MKWLALKTLSFLYNRNDKPTETEVGTLRSYLQDMGEYEDGMALEEIAGLVLLYEIEQEKAKKVALSDLGIARE